MRVRIPPIDVPAIDLKTGKFVIDWYDAIKALEKLGLLDLADVSRRLRRPIRTRFVGVIGAKEIQLRSLIDGQPVYRPVFDQAGRRSGKGEGCGLHGRQHFCSRRAHAGPDERRRAVWAGLCTIYQPD
jgi:hypothetical protein